jgi:hypothetical protein
MTGKDVSRAIKLYKFMLRRGTRWGFDCSKGTLYKGKAVVEPLFLFAKTCN